MARNLFIMSLLWVAWSVFAVLTIILIGDLFWRDVTRTLLRIFVTGALAALGRLVRDHAIQGPALIVIGKVAAIADAARHEQAALAAG